MSAKQKQHYLPQSYQRGWANAAGQVHVYRWCHDHLECGPRATKSTGARSGLYYVPMASTERRNDLEDVFFRRIDQWGADGLELLRSGDPAGVGRFNIQRMSIYLQALMVRNPLTIAEIESKARQHVLESCLIDDYAAHRRTHEPATLEEFNAALDQEGMTEHGAECLRAVVLNGTVRRKLMAMDWQVVTLTNATPLMTSDSPVIRYKGLADPDGLLLLPLSAFEFLAIYNRGGSMRASIERSIIDGTFVEAMNKYLVRHKIDFVYADSADQTAFVARHWCVTETAYVSLLTD